MSKQATDTTLDDLVTAVVNQPGLEGWDSFIADLRIPGDLMPALMTRRTELIKLVQPRPLTAAEMQVLMNLIAGLLQTNWALQDHSRRLGTLVTEWVSAFKGLNTVGRRIEHFANYRVATPEEEE